MSALITALNDSKSFHFLNPSTKSFSWRNIGMVHNMTWIDSFWGNIGTYLLWKNEFF